MENILKTRKGKSYNVTFHNPNTDAEVAKFLADIFIQNNLEKVNSYIANMQENNVIKDNDSVLIK